MANRESRFEKWQPKWWDAMEVLGRRLKLTSDEIDAIHELVLNAIDESAGQWLGATGGRKGGVVRAERMTPEARSTASRHAARIRWMKARP
jgi:hypothetical protein